MTIASPDFDDTTSQMPVAEPTTTPGATLEDRISTVGAALGAALNALIDAVPGDPSGPKEFAGRLGIDKVLASRLLKAARNRDPMAVAFLAPGPDPMRRVLRAAARQGVDAEVIQSATDAVRDFEQLIRRDVGDRIALDAMISFWLPEVRREFETRRKQAAFKAMSQLKGVMAETNLATVLLYPSADGVNLDIVWITGLLGLQRLRPGASVHCTSRRITEDGSPRRPVSLSGVPVDGLEGVRLDEFCSSPPPPLDVIPAGEVVHYRLGDTGYGPRSAVDLVFAEVNRAEMPRYVPREKKRKGYVFAEVGTPVKTLHFDVFVHKDVYPGSEPELLIYDTVLEGVADVNDRGRDIDRLDLVESIEPLGESSARFRAASIHAYTALLDHVRSKMGWETAPIRGYRCRIDYPIYGSQVTMAFDPPAK